MIKIARRKLRWSGTLAIALFLLAAASSSRAQQDSNPKGTPQNSTPLPDKNGGEQAKPADKKPGDRPEDDRLFFAMPNYLTLENGGTAPPLSVKRKFALVTDGAFDYFEFGWYAGLAGISQAENSEPGYGQGLEGFGKRYGSSFADGTIENYMVGAIFSSVLREDPRFYRATSGSFKHQATYAVSRIFVTRTDSGHAQFNFAEILGSAASAAISTYSYHPRADRTLSNTASVWGSEVGYDAITIVIKQFWPEIRRKMVHKKPATN